MIAISSGLSFSLSIVGLVLLLIAYVLLRDKVHETLMRERFDTYHYPEPRQLPDSHVHLVRTTSDLQYVTEFDPANEATLAVLDLFLGGEIVSVIQHSQAQAEMVYENARRMCEEALRPVFYDGVALGWCDAPRR